jgi:hypothetical protein
MTTSDENLVEITSNRRNIPMTHEGTAIFDILCRQTVPKARVGLEVVLVASRTNHFVCQGFHTMRTTNNKTFAAITVRGPKLEARKPEKPSKPRSS